MSAGKQLTDCPSNLKEAIDWILRVTVKDGGGGQNGTTELADAVTQLLGDVKSSTPELHNKFDEIKGALWSGGSNGLLDNLATGLAKFIGYENGKKPDGTIGIVKSGYTSSYPDSSNWNKDFGHNPNHSTAAKIFMGCVPMIFSALSYLYWRCDNEGGGWQDQYFSGTYGIQTDLKDFVVSMGFRFSELNGSQGKTVMATVAKTFQDLSSVSDRISYPAFLKTVREKPSALQPNLQQYPLASLYLLASTYFTHKQSKADSPPTGSPKSIREMLYFLAALPFSPSYDSFSEHISSIFRMLSPKSSDNDAELKLPVAISGSPNKGDYLNPDKMRDYLINTCFFCSIVLGRLQGHSASTSDEPWLHSLYCNSMNLRYPSGSALFNTVANYSYALQFQLSFLHQQCMSGSVNCGWLQCKYGKNVPAHTASHICPTPCKNSSAADCRHDGRAANSTGCKHGDNCGKNSNSPLQAFLTDNLKGFHVSSKSISDSTNHLDNHPPGSMCHVPMGFNPNDLKPSGTGQYIFYTLEPFCGSPVSPLRQLSEKLGCLTKRTPRTLGDMFGFYLQLIDQLFRTRMTQEALAGSILVRLDLSDEFQMFAINRYPPLKNTYEKLVQSLSGSSHPPEPSGLSRSLKAFYNDFPFWFQLFMVPDSRDMAASLFDLRQHCHNPKKNDASEHYDPSGKACNHTANNPADLWSLYCPVHATSAHSTDIQTACRSGNCGGYFSPLTQSTGATYAPIHAAVYLSWVLFLADDLQTGLQELLDEFRNIDCRHWGCKTKSSGACQCSPGQHGINTECSCDSVVHCGGVLPLLYRHGFQFHSPHTLSGGKDGATKRSCDKFHSALSNVLSPDAPLHNLLMAIDEFMYYVRFRFMSLISSFWIFSLAILLYFIVYGTDVLHFKSHVHLPSSHTVPPIGLLTTGKAPALTKLTYYMP